jgi:hypothetical protein
VAQRTCPCGNPVTTKVGLPRCDDCRVAAIPGRHPLVGERICPCGKPARRRYGVAVCNDCACRPDRQAEYPCGKGCGRFIARGLGRRRATVCDECQASRRTNQESVRRIRRHGLTLDRYEDLLRQQGFACANQGCGATNPGGRGTWHVDHDHRCCPGPYSCGLCVRGLLCARCNVILALAEDDPALLRKAAAYIEAHRQLRLIV